MSKKANGTCRKTVATRISYLAFSFPQTKRYYLCSSIFRVMDCFPVLIR